MAFLLRVTVMVLTVIGLTSAECPPLWTRFGDNCYRFMGHEMSWNDAEKHCRQFFTISGSQAHLASVHSSDEDDFLVHYCQSLFGSANDKQVWMGLSDQSNEGTFSWSDGTGLDYNAGWLSGEPNDYESNEDCGEFAYRSTFGGWNDRPCSSRQPHVCKMPNIKGCFE